MSPLAELKQALTQALTNSAQLDMDADNDLIAQICAEYGYVLNGWSSGYDGLDSLYKIDIRPMKRISLEVTA